MPALLEEAVIVAEPAETPRTEAVTCSPRPRTSDTLDPVTIATDSSLEDHITVQDNGYKQPGYNQGGYKPQQPYKQQPYKPDPYKQDPYKPDPYKPEPPQYQQGGHSHGGSGGNYPPSEPSGYDGHSHPPSYTPPTPPTYPPTEPPQYTNSQSGGGDSGSGASGGEAPYDPMGSYN